ncbi:hypothetical protein MTO96_016149 [Rhipicephalus appendiculatus]
MACRPVDHRLAARAQRRQNILATPVGGAHGIGCGGRTRRAVLAAPTLSDEPARRRSPWGTIRKKCAEVDPSAAATTNARQCGEAARFCSATLAKALQPHSSLTEAEPGTRQHSVDSSQ